MYDAVILVVDDEQAYLASITETLRKKNFKILQALNGNMGIKVTKQFMPDIIIADWEMPELNGLQMIQDLKADETTKDIPIIMCTGKMTTSENLDTALAAGACDYIRKPIDPIELTARINSALHLSKAFKKINKQNDELIQLNNTKDKFFSLIAHDLKSPFQGLLGFSEFLTSGYETLSDKEKKEYISIIGELSKSAYKLLDNLLTWSGMQRGKMPFNPRNISLLSELDATFTLLKQTALNKQIEIEICIEDSTVAWADIDMLSAIVRNLVSNSIKFTKPGGKISISAIKLENKLRFCVNDTGVGIKKDMLGKIFELNSNVRTIGTANEAGTGLGLILCKEMVEKHGGTISVESEQGKGSMFSFELPINLQAPNKN
ncbi:MAG: hybrid sensor histidine kinase/response regulator [Ignavibacteria bacterium]|nr:hybrid sensor histidine kinase/response regulator [Ignavibacteria bacterium]